MACLPRCCCCVCVRPQCEGFDHCHWWVGNAKQAGESRTRHVAVAVLKSHAAARCRLGIALAAACARAWWSLACRNSVRGAATAGGCLGAPPAVLSAHCTRVDNSSLWLWLDRALPLQLTGTLPASAFGEWHTRALRLAAARMRRMLFNTARWVLPVVCRGPGDSLFAPPLAGCDVTARPRRWRCPATTVASATM